MIYIQIYIYACMEEIKEIKAIRLFLETVFVIILQL